MRTDSEQMGSADENMNDNVNQKNPMAAKEVGFVQDVGSTETDATSESGRKTKLSFEDQLKQYQDELEMEYQEYSKKLEESGHTGQLSNMDWDALQEKYETEMAEKIRDEEEIMKDISSTVQQFMLWMQVSNQKESERARKRLRTRITKVQMTERDLVQKQEHEKKVRQAFEAAVKMLSDIT